MTGRIEAMGQASPARFRPPGQRRNRLHPCDSASSPTLQVVCPYLEALARLDHDAMAAFWAPDRQRAR
jgi:hypothetical protein